MNRREPLKAARTDTWASALLLLQGLYDAEIQRLADVYRPRILAGEFSGSTPPPRDEVRHLSLERELAETHPWLATVRGRVVVEGSSRWLLDREKALTNPKTGEALMDGYELAPGDAAAECMAHDILAAAAARGWVKPMRYLGDEPYVLKVA